MYRCDNCGNVFSGSPVRVTISDWYNSEDEHVLVYDRKIEKYIKKFIRTLNWTSPAEERNLCPVCYAQETGENPPEISQLCHCTASRLLPVEETQQDHRGERIRRMKNRVVRKKLANPCLQCERRHEKTNGSAIQAQLPLIGSDGTEVLTSARDIWAEELRELEDGFRRVVNSIKDTCRAMGEDAPPYYDILRDNVRSKDLIRASELRTYLGQAEWFHRDIFDNAFVYAEKIWELKSWKRYMDDLFPGYEPNVGPVDMIQLDPWTERRLYLERAEIVRERKRQRKNYGKTWNPHGRIWEEEEPRRKKTY